MRITSYRSLIGFGIVVAVACQSGQSQDSFGKRVKEAIVAAEKPTEEQKRWREATARIDALLAQPRAVGGSATSKQELRDYALALRVKIGALRNEASHLASALSPALFKEFWKTIPSTSDLLRANSSGKISRWVEAAEKQVKDFDPAISAALAKNENVRTAHAKVHEYLKELQKVTTDLEARGVEVPDVVGCSACRASGGLIGYRQVPIFGDGPKKFDSVFGLTPCVHCRGTGCDVAETVKRLAATK